jgi:hypothetical protein
MVSLGPAFVVLRRERYCASCTVPGTGIVVASDCGAPKIDFCP